MDSFTQLLAQRPLVFIHLACAASAVVLGAVLLLRRKGTPSHRALGWAWVLLMAGTTITSAFIRERGMINVAGFSPIHLLTVLVAVQLPRAVIAIRQGRVEAHRKAMRGMYFGGCVVAGLFTLMPGRFLGRQLWGAVGTLLG
jgi:uncharacterized membrane protein